MDVRYDTSKAWLYQLQKTADSMIDMLNVFGPNVSTVFTHSDP